MCNILIFDSNCVLFSSNVGSLMHSTCIERVDCEHERSAERSIPVFLYFQMVTVWFYGNEADNASMMPFAVSLKTNQVGTIDQSSASHQVSTIENQANRSTMGQTLTIAPENMATASGS